MSDGAIFDVAAHDVFDEERPRSPTPIPSTVSCNSWQIVTTTSERRTIWSSAHVKTRRSRPDRLYLKLLSCCGRLECMS